MSIILKLISWLSCILVSFYFVHTEDFEHKQCFTKVKATRQRKAVPGTTWSFKAIKQLKINFCACKTTLSLFLTYHSAITPLHNLLLSYLAARCKQCNTIPAQSNNTVLWPFCWSRRAVVTGKGSSCISTCYTQLLNCIFWKFRSVAPAICSIIFENDFLRLKWAWCPSHTDPPRFLWFISADYAYAPIHSEEKVLLLIINPSQLHMICAVLIWLQVLQVNINKLFPEGLMTNLIFLYDKNYF